MPQKIEAHDLGFIHIFDQRLESEIFRDVREGEGIKLPEEVAQLVGLRESVLKRRFEEGIANWLLRQPFSFILLPDKTIHDEKTDIRGIFIFGKEAEKFIIDREESSVPGDFPLMILLQTTDQSTKTHKIKIEIDQPETRIVHKITAVGITFTEIRVTESGTTYYNVNAQETPVVKIAPQYCQTDQGDILLFFTDSLLSKYNQDVLLAG